MEPIDRRQTSHAESRRGKGLAGGIIGKVAAAVVVILALCGVIWFANRALSVASSNSAVTGKEFQAVFLTNGQVYFGKLSRVTSSDIKLTNIYYLQVSNSGSQSTVQPSSSSSSNQQVSLAKLGSELHGPEDSMYINRDQVLFWENLKSDGKVTQAINNYQKTNK